MWVSNVRVCACGAQPKICFKKNCPWYDFVTMLHKHRRQAIFLASQDKGLAIQDYDLAA